MAQQAECYRSELKGEHSHTLSMFLTDTAVQDVRLAQSLNCAPKRVFPAPLALVLAQFSSPIFLIKHRLKTLVLCGVSETSSAQGWGLSQGKPS